MWDEIVENDWYLAVGNAISKAAKDEGKSVDRFQKYLSQLMAEESKGRAWVMAPKDVDFAQLKRKDEQEKKNAW